MYYIEVNKRIKQIVKVFRLFGIWRIEDEPNIYRRKTLQLLIFGFLVTFAISLTYRGSLSDLKYESVYLIISGIAASVAAVKLIYFIWKQEEIYQFIENIGAHSVVDHKYFLKNNEKVNNLIKFSSSLFLIILVSVVLLIIFCLPVFSKDKVLPYNVWFPVDWKNSTIAYWIAYAYVSSCMMTCNISTLINIIIWYLMMNCSIKYQILGNHFRNMFSKKSTLENEILSQKEIVSLIRTHQNITNTTDRLKSCFANLFFIQITTSAISICGSVYALAFGAKSDTLFQCMFSVSVLLYNIFDIFMVMYFGNEITLSSNRLSYCLFESNWLEQSRSSQKIIIILAEVLKQPKELVVGKVYPLNMKTFTSIVNLAYSMLNILQKLN